MLSTKKSSPKNCIKCSNLLTPQNWGKSDYKIGYYICKPCRKIKDKEYHSNPDYNKNQSARYRMRRSAVIFYYGNQCSICQEDNYDKLTMYHIKGGPINLNQLYNEPVNRDDYCVMCYNCGCAPNTDKAAFKIKTAVLMYYGGYCVDCNEDKIERLTLNCKVSAKRYRQIFKDKPSGIQIMCFNCRHSREGAEQTAKREIKSSQASKY